MISSEPPVLFLATSNTGKRAEFARLLPPGVRVLGLDDVRVTLPPETGTTFAENAGVKALAAADQTGLLALADDSGLEVDALNGAPGVCSARFAGEPASDERNRAALLAALADVPPEHRTARFACAVAIARHGRIVARASGTCDGFIARSPSGTFGFGYDPIFVLPDGRTMAELQPSEKNRVSHRARAYRKIMPILLRELGLAASTEARP
jgi:XTP/dITP diphosphohydrolase